MENTMILRTGAIPVERSIRQAMCRGLDIAETDFRPEDTCSKFSGYKQLSILAEIEDNFPVDVDFDQDFTRNTTLGEILEKVTELVTYENQRVRSN